jgi:very-short-patch-repair endonuclease
LIIPDTSAVKIKSPLPLQYEQLNQSPSPLLNQVKLEETDEIIQNPTVAEQLNQPLSPLLYQVKLGKTDEMTQDPTDAENQMWKILKRNVMPLFPEHVFQFQYVTHVQRGYILDFYCPSLSLVIELDDDSHDITRGFDWESYSDLKNKGVEVVRVSNSEVFVDPVEVAMSICKIIEEKMRALTHF